MTDKKHAPLLIDEPTILVYPSLAVALGINKAIVFQQLHFLMNSQKQSKNKANFVDSRWWVYNSYAEWQKDYFPWLSVSTLKGIFLELEQEGLITARQLAKHKSDRRKWYSIDYEQWDKKCLVIGQKMSHQPSDNNCPMDETENVLSNGQKMSDGLTETSTETSTEKGESPAPEIPSIPTLKEKIEATHVATPEDPTPLPPPPSQITNDQARKIVAMPRKEQNAALDNLSNLAIIESWLKGNGAHTSAISSRSDKLTALKVLIAGYTPEEVYDLTVSKVKEKGEFYPYAFMVSDLPSCRVKVVPKNVPAAYVPLPAAPPTSQEEIDAIKSQAFAEDKSA